MPKGRGFNVRRHFDVVPVEKRTLDGVVFASRDEMIWFANLQLRERAGQITDLKRQVTFHWDVYLPNGDGTYRPARLGKWTCDATYMERIDGQWRLVVADRKQVDTSESRRVRRVTEAIYGFNVLLS